MLTGPTEGGGNEEEGIQKGGLCPPAHVGNEGGGVDERGRRGEEPKWGERGAWGFFVLGVDDT